MLVAGGCNSAEARAGGATGVAVGKTAESRGEGPVADDSQLEELNVKTMLLSSEPLSSEIVAQGVAAPLREVTYSAEVSGRIDRLNAELGERIARGQVLARIDWATLKAQLEQAEAQRDLARATHERLARLGDDDLVSRQRVDEVSTQLRSAEAAVAIARAALAKSVVRASTAGVVTAKHVERSEYVGPGTPLVSVMDHSRVYVDTRVPETQVARIRVGTQARAHVDALGRSYDGAVETIVPTADPMSRVFTVRVAVPNPDLEILVGMSASVRIRVGAPAQAILVPHSAVVEERGGKVVYLVDGDVARRRPVVIGASHGQQVVIDEGVSADERLVVVGQRSLRDGQRVRVVDSAAR